MKTKAYIHSLKDKRNDVNVLDECEILSHEDNNNAVVLYNGKKCTAVFNVFVGAYYVDDVYGVIEEGEDIRLA